MASPIFETERLLLQPHKPADWVALHRLASDPEMMRYITGGVPFEEAWTVAFLERQAKHLAGYGYCRWKLTHKGSGEYVGFCGAEHKMLDGELVPEIGWWIAREHWRNGFASEAAACAFNHLWEIVKVPRLTSCAFPENGASIRVMEKIGLSFEKYFPERSPITGEEFRLVLYSRTR